MNDLYRALFDDNPEMILVIDTKGFILHSNTAAESCFELSRKKAGGTNLKKYFTPEAKSEFEQCLELAEPEIFRRFEADMQLRPGIFLPAEIDLRAISFQGKQAILCIFRDLSDRKRTDECIHIQAGLLDAIGQAVIATDLTGKITYWNRASEILFGWKASEMRGNSIFEISLTSPFRDETWNSIIEHSRAHTSWTGEITLTRKNGSSFPSLLTINSVLDNNGSRIGVIGISTDITDRLKMENAVRENEEKYRQLFEMESDAIFLIDNSTGEILEVNPAAEVLYGYSRDEFLGMRNVDVSAEPEKTFLTTVQRLSSVPIRFHRRKNGEVFPVEIMASHFTWSGREVHIAAIRDITERIRAQEEIENQRAFLQEVVDVNPTFIYVLDRDGRTVLANETFKQFMGVFSEELSGKNTAEMQPDDEIARAMYNDDMAVLRGEQKKIEREEPYRDKLGNTRWLYTIKVPMRNNRGEIVNLFGVSMDITDRKEAEEALRESEMKFRALFEDALNPVFIADEDGCYIGTNRAGLEFLECGMDEFVGKTVWDYMPADMIKIQSENPVPFLTRSTTETVYLINGKIKTLLLNVVPLNHSGRTFFYGIGHDITERKRVEAALRQSEEKFSKAFLSSPNIIIISEIETGRYIDVNESFVKVFGYSREEAIGHTAKELNNWQNIEDRGKIVSILRNTGALHNFEVQLLSRDGSEIICLLSMETMEFEGMTCIISVLTDISAQKVAERALKEKSDILKNILLAAPVGIALVENRTIHWTNETMLSLFECSPVDLFGKSTEILYASEKTFKEIGEEIYPVLWSGDSVCREFRFQKKDGSFFEGLLQLRAFNPDDPVRRAIMTVTDITLKKQAEDELTAEKERLLVTLRSICDAVIATDTSGNVLLMNRVAEELTGWTHSEALGMKLQNIFHITDILTHEIMENPLGKALESGEMGILANHSVLISRHGIERIIENSLAPILDRDGSVIGVVLVFRDITEKLKMEDEIQKTQKLESIGILAGGIAHDFNNILTGVLGNIALAKMCAEPGDEIYTVLQEAEEESFRARDLTMQLLTFSKGGAPIRKVTSITDLLRSSVNFALRGSNVRCEFSMSEDLWPAMVDEGQFRQVINNLIINADQSMPRGGVIKVDAKNILADDPRLPLKKGKYVRISITDQGIGIPKENLKKIFDPYFTTKPTGHGLGLATTHSIVRKHDGHIEVESESGAGSTFHVYYPALERRSKPRKAERYNPMPGQGKILIMDDEESIRTTTGRLLNRLGYTVETAQNGAEALELYRSAMDSQEPFAAVIMDVTVPGGMGGKETIQFLKELDPGVRAIVSSGYSDAHIMAEFAQYGFSGMISKPYRLEDLSRVLNTLLNNEKWNPEPLHPTS